MPRYAPENIREPREILASGAYVGTFEEFDDSQATSTGKYQIQVVLAVEDPAEARGSKHFERFVIGSDSDPKADDPQTWEMRDGKQNFAAQLFCDALKKAGVSPSGDTNQDFAYAKGQRVGFIVKQSVQAAVNSDGTPNAYAGRIQSQVSGFFRVGEREAKVYEAQAPRPAATPATHAAPPAPPRAAPPGAVGTPRAPVAPAPQAPRPPQPVAAPAPPVAPVAPAPPVAATAAAVPAQPRVPRAPRVPRSDVTKCQICSNLVPHSDALVQAWDQANPWMYEQRDDGVYQLGIARHVEVCVARNVPEE